MNWLDILEQNTEGLIPITLLLTLIGAFATFTADDRNARKIALIFSIPAAIIMSLIFLHVGISSGGHYSYVTNWKWVPSLGIGLSFGVDGLSASLAWLTSILTPLVILYSWNEKKQPRLFFAMLMLLNTSVIGVFTTLDLFLFYIFWEFVLIPMFFLIAIWGGPERKYASYKFFVYTGGASLVMLLGFMAVFFATGGNTFHIPTITSIAAASGFTQAFGLVTFAILALGFLVKLPSVPFHTWLPDAHVQAPTAGSVMLAGVLLKMGSYGLMRIAFPMLPDAAMAFQWPLFWLGVISVLYGAFLCLAQDDMKSLIAYSSVSHMGMITIALVTFNDLGWAGAAYMNVAHGIISAGMFMAAGSLQHSTGTRLISKLGGIAGKTPHLAALTAALFLGSLGLPGMMGFIAEFTIFAAVWETFGWWIMIPIWSVLITAGYYLWALQRTFYGSERRHPDVDWDHMHDVVPMEKYTMFALVLLAIILGILPAIIMGQYDQWTHVVLEIMGVALMGFFDFLLVPFDWQIFTAELVILLFALFVALVGAKARNVADLRQMTLLGLGGSFFIVLGSLLGWNFNVPGLGIRFTLEYIGHGLKDAYVITEASQLFKLIFVGAAFLAVYSSAKPIRGQAEEDHGEFYSLILFATLGMMIVASSQELITLLIGIEIASMSSYLLSAFQRDRDGAEASMKYFLFGAASSGLSLYAISLLYGMTGTTHIPTLGQELVAGGSFDAVGMIAIVFLAAGLGFKISSAPFHLWAPDVYYGSPAPVAGMLASASKAMGFAALFNVFLVGLIGFSANWQLAMAAIAVVTMFVGNLIALQQQSIRRMLAYSSVAQAGYLLIALVVAGAAWSTNAFYEHGTYAVGGGILHLMVNAAMKLGAFLIVGALLILGIPDRIDDWKGLGKRSAFLAFAMTIFLLSMAGLPPLGGFTSKFVLFSSAVDLGVSKELGWIVWLAVFAVLNSAISLFYYVRVIRAMYVEEHRDGDQAALDVPMFAKISVGICLAMVFIVGLYPTWFVDVSMEAAASLLATASP